MKLVSSSDIQNDFGKYLPNISGSIKDFNAIANNVNNKERKINSELMNKSEYCYKTSLFDLMKNANQNNQRSIYFLRYIDELYLKVTKNLSNILLKNIKDIVNNLVNEPFNFMDRVSELAVIDFLLCSSDFKIHSMEKKLSNNKSMDLELCFEDNLILVDILSIHMDEEKIESEEKFLNFLIHRIEDKLNKKTGNLTDKEKSNFYLFVVLHEMSDFIHKYSNSFNHDDLLKEYKVLSFFSFMEYKNENEKNFKFQFDVLENNLNLRKKYLNEKML